MDQKNGYNEEKTKVPAVEIEYWRNKSANGGNI